MVKHVTSNLRMSIPPRNGLPVVSKSLAHDAIAVRVCVCARNIETFLSHVRFALPTLHLGMELRRADYFWGATTEFAFTAAAEDS